MSNRWELSSLLKRKLWIVTGKGGVGKTTIAAALGLMASKMGLKTLLVETHGLSHLGDLLKVGAVGYEPTEINTNLHLSQITPEKAFEEYVLQQIKLKMVYNAVFKNRYVRHFIDAAPGLNELLTIGKIWALVEGKFLHGKRKIYDLVIVDAPSTGHGLSLLTVPQIVGDAIRVGPLKTKADEILTLLHDPEKTMTWVVTLPEEMPINEAVEMAQKVEETAKIELGPIVINSIWPEILDEAEMKELQKVKVEAPLFNVYQKRLEQSRFYSEKIQSKLSKKQFLQLPLIYEFNNPYRIAEKLCGSIMDQLTKKT